MSGSIERPWRQRVGDGTPIVVNSPASEGWLTWFTSRGDDLAGTSRGTGPQLKCEFTGAETDIDTDIQFLEPVQIHDGQLSWEPSEWGHDDHFSLKILMPATVATPNAGNGNANLVPTGLGYNLIVPAAGDGSHDVDLDQAVPVPVGIDGGGFWEVNERTGAVSPSPEAQRGNWHLLDVPITSHFIRCVSMGNPRGVFDVDVYQAEWISERWIVRLSVTRASAGAATTGGWLMLFREFAT